MIRSINIESNRMTMKKLDLTKRPRELLSRAYELAARVYEVAPWKEMDERQLLVVELKDGRKRVLSVMGEQGTHYAIALYPSKAEYEQISSIDDHDREDLKDAFFGVNQLQLSFERASDLMDGEMKDIRASGAKFKRGVNPSFVSYVAGFAPARVGGEELAEVVDVIEAFLSYLDEFGSSSIPIVKSTSQLLPTWTEDAAGLWTKGENDFSGCLPVAVNLDQSLVDKVASLRVRKGLFLEVGAFVVPVGRGVDKRGKMSRLLLIVDGPTAMPLGTNVFSAPDDAEFDWSESVECVLTTFLQMGVRPENLAVFGRSLHAVFKNITRNSFPGTKFWDHCPCDSAHQVFEAVSVGL